MNSSNTTYNQQDRYGAFWNRMAEHYPDPLDAKTLSETNEILSIVKGKGVEIHGADILDIGCGTGTYSLPLADDAETVTGLDNSDAMVDRLTELIAFSGVRNVYPVKASWKDIDIIKSGFERAFDIVLASMTPAVQTQQDFDKMEGCSKKWCVYIGWGRKRENELMEEMFKLHGLDYGPPSGAGVACDMLAQAGRRPSVDYFETFWDWTGNVDEAVEDIECFIEMHGGQADRDLIEKSLHRFEHQGSIFHRTFAEEIIMVWQVS